MAMSRFSNNPRLTILTALVAVFACGAVVGPAKACNCAAPVYYYAAPVYYYATPVYYYYTPPVYYYAPPTCYAPSIYYYAAPRKVIPPLAKPKTAAPQTQTKEGKLVHAQYALYELREAKEDVRKAEDLPPASRTRLLGAIDKTIGMLKEVITAAGEKPQWIPPTDKPAETAWKHLRHAVKMLKKAREQLKVETGVPEESRTKGTQQINDCINLLEGALDAIK